MDYNFDEIIDRKGTNSTSFEGWKQYMFGMPKDAVFPFKEEEYIRMWVADMDLATPAQVLDAMRERLDRKILGYTGIFDEEYYTVLTNWFKKRYNWEINLEQMIISPGIIPALFRLVGLLTNEGENVLILTPSYTPFKAAGEAHGRKVYYSRMFDPEDIARQLDDPERNIRLFIFCNPHNPTGRVWTKEELYRIGRICLDRGVRIISDEIHCDLLRMGQQHIPLASLFPESELIVTCTAPSKTFNLAGNLMSHIFIPDKAVRERWQRLHVDLLSPLSVAAVQAAYGQCEDWLDQLRVYLDGNFAYLDAQLKQHLPLSKFTVPGATYLAWVDISAYIREENMPLYFAQQAGVLLESGSMFVENGEGFVRLNVACPRAVLEEGVRRIVGVLK